MRAPFSPDESRTAMVGRKRRRQDRKGAAQSIDKRQKLDLDQDYLPLDDSSSYDRGYSALESGEISEHSTGRRSSLRSNRSFHSQSNEASVGHPATRQQHDSRRRLDGTAAKTGPKSKSTKRKTTRAKQTLANGDHPATTPASVSSKWFIPLEIVTPDGLREVVKARIAEDSRLSTQGALERTASQNMGYSHHAKKFLDMVKRGHMKLDFSSTSDIVRLNIVLDEAAIPHHPLDLAYLEERKESQALARHVQQMQSDHPHLTCKDALVQLAERGEEYHRTARIALERYVYIIVTRGTHSSEQLSVAAKKQKNAKDGRVPAEQAPGSKTTDEVNSGVLHPSVLEQAPDLDSLPSPATDRSMSAASVGNIPMNVKGSNGTEDANTTAQEVPVNLVRLFQISPAEQVLQQRYFLISEPHSAVRCLDCGSEGHMAIDCPAKTCDTCKTNAHSQSMCPKTRKCTRCRQRGHSGQDCGNATVPPGALGDECDLCGNNGHAEEECGMLWCSFKVDKEVDTKSPSTAANKGCYNCGSNHHWGDDCPILPDFVARYRTCNPTFSARNAAKYTLSESWPRDSQLPGGANGNALQSGSIPAYQLQQLHTYF